MRVSLPPADCRRGGEGMRAATLGIGLLLCAGLASAPRLSARSAPPASAPDSCAPQAMTLPFAALSPRNLNNWVSNTEMKDRWCQDVAIAELRSRAKKNAVGDLQISFKVTTSTKPGRDRWVSVRIEVLVADQVLRSTTIEAIEASEKKNGQGSTSLVLPSDILQGQSDPVLRISLKSLDD